MKNRILITGASGFIGGYLTSEALTRKYEVYVAVRSTSNINGFINKDVRIIEFDFTDTSKIASMLESLPKFDYIIHNAGLTKTLDKYKYFEVNFGITKNLIDAILKKKLFPKKIIYISTLAAYGPGSCYNCDPILLSSTPKPVTSYGASKLAAERYLKSKTEIPYIIIRPTAVYGPGEKDIFQSIRLINKGFNFKIGRSKQYLTFIYVKDLARVVFDALESPLINKEYFVSDGHIYQHSDLGKAVAKCLNKKYINVIVPVWFAKLLAGINQTTAMYTKKAPALNIEKVKELAAANWNCDVQPLKNDLHFTAGYRLDQGMAETVKWYIEEGWLS